MEEDILGPAQVNRIIYLNKKRKFEAQLPGIPLSKHVRWDQEPESDSSSDSSSEPKRMRSNIFTGEDELVAIPASGCFGYNSNSDSVASQQDDSRKTSLPCTRPHSYLDPSSSSSTWTSAFFELNSYSLETRELNQTSSSKLESLSIGGLHPPDNFEDQGQGIETEYQNEGIETEYQNEGIETEDAVLNSLYYSTMIAPYAQQGAGKITIDTEFEDYFSMLMM